MRTFLFVAALVAGVSSAQAQQVVDIEGPIDVGQRPDWIAPLPNTPYVPPKPTASLGSCNWLSSSLSLCSAEELADQRERDRRAADAKWNAYLANLELSCRMESITYFQYTGCLEVGAIVYGKANR
jgi:hypothetical protein